MQISLQNCFNFNNYQLNKRINYSTQPKLKQLSCDTISFGALKKHQFEGIDYAVVEKYKAPIEKFNSNEDFQKWCGECVKKDVLDKDFGGRHQETKIQRKAMLKEWTDYVLNENDAYNNATSLLILSSVSKDLRPDNDKLPAVLNKGVLADSIAEIEDNLKIDNKYQFDFNKIYNDKMQALYLEDVSSGETDSKWVVIPSKEHDSENFADNVDKLKTLSHSRWCTKSYNAAPYLSDGDFHVYLENGKPKLGVRFVGDKVQEIQGELNNSRVPLDYYDVVKKHIEDEHLQLAPKANLEMEEAKKKKIQTDKVRAVIGDAIKNKDTKTILEYFGHNVEEDEDGKLTIDCYNQLKQNYSYSDLGINENDLFKDIKQVKGNVNLNGSNVTSLGNLENIDGDLCLWGAILESFGNLKRVGRDISRGTQALPSVLSLDSIGNINIKELKKVASNNSSPEEIFKLIGISTKKDKKGFLNISEYHQPIENEILSFKELGVNEDNLLANVKRINGNADFRDSELEELKNVESIGGDTFFENSKIKSLGKLKNIGGDAVFIGVKLEDLGNLTTIGRNATFCDSSIKSVGNLKRIGGDVDIDKDKPIKGFENVKIKGKIYDGSYD